MHADSLISMEAIGRKRNGLKSIVMQKFCKGVALIVCFGRNIRYNICSFGEEQEKRRDTVI